MRRAQIEAVILIVALAHVGIAAKAAFSRPDPAQAERIFLRAKAAEEAGDFPQAAVGFMEIYEHYPYYANAAEAGVRLSRVALWWNQNLDAADEVLQSVAEGYPGTIHGEGSRKKLEFLRRHRAGGDEPVALFFKAVGRMKGKEKDAAGARALIEELIAKHPNASILSDARKFLAEISGTGGGG